MSEVFEQLEAHRAYVGAVNNNGTQEAIASFLFETRGMGEGIFKSAVDLGLLFIDKPTFTSGVELLGGNLAGEIVAGKFPRVDAGVLRWKQDRRGFYTGAWLYFVVDGGAYRLGHHLQFTGMAIKMLQAEFFDGLS